VGVVEATFEGAVLALGVFEDTREPGLVYSGLEVRSKVARKLEAYKRFVNISAIALGILQVLAMRRPESVWHRFPLWLRTLPKHGYPSENVVRLTLQHEVHRISLTSSPGLLLTNILEHRKRAAPGAAHPMRIAA
jgi:hypothetical protein